MGFLFLFLKGQERLDIGWSGSPISKPPGGGTALLPSSRIHMTGSHCREFMQSMCFRLQEYNQTMSLFTCVRPSVTLKGRKVKYFSPWSPRMNQRHCISEAWLAFLGHSLIRAMVRNSQGANTIDIAFWIIARSVFSTNFVKKSTLRSMIKGRLSQNPF